METMLFVSKLSGIATCVLLVVYLIWDIYIVRRENER